MDLDAASDLVARYLADLDVARGLPMISGERRKAVRALNQSIPAINALLRSLGPDFPTLSTVWLSDHLASRAVMLRARAVLRASQGIVAADSDVPLLPWSALDPAIADPALTLWRARKYRQAVGEASTCLNHFAQVRLGRSDVSDKDLMGQAFSDKPPEPGKARLRCPGPSSETTASLQEGARAFSIGVFQSIRNPAHHKTGDWNAVTAFHHLVALSQVAHWFRYWDVAVYQSSTEVLEPLTMGKPAPMQTSRDN